MHHPVPIRPCGKLSAVGVRPAFLLSLIAAAALAGCGASAPVKNAAPSPQQLKSDLRGSPPPLAGLHSQANHLLPGGLVAFRTRIAALHGYPVVVNKWASWCGPCVGEFPILQRVAAKLGRTVAFVGIDVNDGTGAPGAAFLKRFPVSYPSYLDPHAAISNGIGASTYQPMTLFFSRANHRSYVFEHAGPYLSVAAFEHDVERYTKG